MQFSVPGLLAIDTFMFSAIPGGHSGRAQFLERRLGQPFAGTQIFVGAAGIADLSGDLGDRGVLGLHRRAQNRIRRAKPAEAGKVRAFIAFSPHDRGVVTPSRWRHHMRVAGQYKQASVLLRAALPSGAANDASGAGVGHCSVEQHRLPVDEDVAHPDRDIVAAFRTSLCRRSSRDRKWRGRRSFPARACRGP